MKQSNNSSPISVIVLLVLVLLATVAVKSLLDTAPPAASVPNHATVAVQTSPAKTINSDDIVAKYLRITAFTVMPCFMVLSLLVWGIAAYVNNRRINRWRSMILQLISEGKSPEDAFALVARSIAKTPKQIQEVEERLKERHWSEAIRQ